MILFVDYENRDAVDATNLMLSDKAYCKKLLGIYLGTSNESTIDRYYEAYKKIRKNGHFDPEVEGGSFSWNWSAFFAGPLFFLYRKRYGYMLGTFAVMFFFFWPSLFFAGIFANSAILNSFSITIAEALDEANMDQELVEKSDKIDDDADPEVHMKFVIDNICPVVETRLRKRGGTNMLAYALPIGLLVLVIVLHLTVEL